MDQCGEATFQLSPLENDEFSKMFETRRMKFVEWIKPAALYIQGATGLPASIVIAQAGMASDWGASPSFRNNNNIFNHTCWAPRTSIRAEIEMNGQKFPYKGACGVEKTFAKVGRPFKFAAREDSLLAYLHMILFAKSKYYKNLQDELKRGHKFTPPRQASFRSIAGVLNAFAHDSRYLGSLQEIIQAEKLSTYDLPNCWQCLVQQGKRVGP